MRWEEIETAAPEIAARGRERIEEFGFVLIGTIRADGTPRISPIEAHFVGGHLIVVMMAGTHKAADVRRDPRIVLNAVVTDAHDPGAEFKVRGRVVPVDDTDFRAAAADVIEARSGWRLPDHWHLFRIDVDDVAHIAWKSNRMRMDRWSRDGGLEHAEKTIDI
jgi:hypothetical protein